LLDFGVEGSMVSSLISLSMVSIKPLSSSNGEAVTLSKGVLPPSSFPNISSSLSSTSLTNESELDSSDTVLSLQNLDEYQWSKKLPFRKEKHSENVVCEVLGMFVQSVHNL